MRSMVLIKTVLLFTLLVLLLRLKMHISIAVLVSGLVLGISFNLTFYDIGLAALDTLRSSQTINLSLTVGLILILSELLKESGQFDTLSRMILATFGVHRITYTILPALVGLLPMPGGALFSAPLLDNVGNEYVPAHKKTLINYWFRHIWEYAWPLYPGLVLAAGLGKTNLYDLAIFQAPMTIVSIIGGMIFLFPGIKMPDRPTRCDIGTGRPQESSAIILWPLEQSDLRPSMVGCPSAVSDKGALQPRILGSKSFLQLPKYNSLRSNSRTIKNNIIELFKIFYLTLPIIIIILLFLLTRLTILYCLLIGLGWVIINVIIFHQLKPLALMKILFLKASVYKMILIVVTILVFTGILQASTLTNDLVHFFHNQSSGNIPWIYLMLSVIFLPFIVGLLTGMTMAFVGVTFPIIFSGLMPAGTNTLPMVMLAYASGFSGVMLSPVHLCLILTNQYYDSALGRVYRYLIPIVLLVLVSAIAMFWIYS